MKKISARPCRICETKLNPIVASEQPCALWHDKPWMPEGHYTLIRCRNCGDLYIDSDVDEKYLDNLMRIEIPEFTNKTIYESSKEVEVLRNKELTNNWEMIKQKRKPLRGEKLLDYGSAWGAFGNIARKDGVVPNGIELQPAAVRASLRLWGEGVVHDGPVQTVPFMKGEFQYITSFETLEHLFDPIKVLADLKELLSDDGIITISVPSSTYFAFKYWVYCQQPFHALMKKYLPGNMKEGRILVHNHINTFSVKSAKLMLQKAGLTPIFTSSIGWRGGRIGNLFSYLGKFLWTISRRNIAFAPSIFIVAKKR